MHGCTQLGHAITGLPMQIDLTEAPRPPARPAHLHAQKVARAGQSLETRGLCWAQAGQALTEPSIISLV